MHRQLAERLADLHAHRAAAQAVGGNECRARADEWIEHQIVRVAVQLDQPPRQLLGEGRWVTHAPRIRPGEGPGAERPGQKLVASDVAAATIPRRTAERLVDRKSTRLN